MKNFQNLSDGQKIEALICFADIVGFAPIAESMDEAELIALLKNVYQTAADTIGASPGMIVKYIGDAMLAIFPDERIDEGVRTMLSLKEKQERLFASRKLNLRITFACHVGPVTAVVLPPIDRIDVIGRSVNTAAMLEKQGKRGRFIISTQTFRRLETATRKRFHKFTPPIVYMAE
jgi:class 3 adenylate cyclase